MTMTAEFRHERPSRRHTTGMGQPHLSVQITSTLLFGAFAITAVVIAFDHFWPAAVLLAIVLGWRGGFGTQAQTPVNVDEIVDHIRSLGPDAQQRRSGNASFDAYRDDVLNRLEVEQENFDQFLDRLRDAKDKSEFDHFMDERARDGQMLD